MRIKDIPYPKVKALALTLARNDGKDEESKVGSAFCWAETHSINKNKDDSYKFWFAVVSEAWDEAKSICPELFTEEVTINVSIPEGYRETGEYRLVREGEYGLGEKGKIREGVSHTPRIILIKDRWKPKHKDYYWFITGIGETRQIHWYSDKGDRARHKIGNCFQTKEEAERVRDTTEFFKPLED